MDRETKDKAHPLHIVVQTRLHPRFLMLTKRTSLKHSKQILQTSSPQDGEEHYSITRTQPSVSSMELCTQQGNVTNVIHTYCLICNSHFQIYHGFHLGHLLLKLIKLKLAMVILAVMKLLLTDNLMQSFNVILIVRIIQQYILNRYRHQRN